MSSGQVRIGELPLDGGAHARRSAGARRELRARACRLMVGVAFGMASDTT